LRRFFARILDESNLWNPQIEREIEEPLVPEEAKRAVKTRPPNENRYRSLIRGERGIEVRLIGY
jgi:hypothetical protein